MISLRSFLRFSFHIITHTHTEFFIKIYLVSHLIYKKFKVFELYNLNSPTSRRL
jgi:hypothetical protein